LNGVNYGEHRTEVPEDGFQLRQRTGLKPLGAAGLLPPSADTIDVGYVIFDPAIA
jgi:hypothetical protein